MTTLSEPLVLTDFLRILQNIRLNSNQIIYWKFNDKWSCSLKVSTSCLFRQSLSYGDVNPDDPIVRKSDLKTFWPREISQEARKYLWILRHKYHRQVKWYSQEHSENTCWMFCDCKISGWMISPIFD